MSSLGIITLYSYSDWNIGKKYNVTSNMAKSHPGSTGSVEYAIILQIFFLRSGDGYCLGLNTYAPFMYLGNSEFNVNAS